MEQTKVAVLGLGYVGLPLALAFGQKCKTIGFDVQTKKIEAYRKGIDPTGEMLAEDFSGSTQIEFTCEIEDLRNCDFYIVAVPTPIDVAKNPDLSLLAKASESVGKVMGKGAIVVYESTVYPGATEEYCVPILEQVSGLKFGQDFEIGYSPERMNPGDKEHSLARITKVVSGSTEEVCTKVADLYGMVVDAGVYKASSVKVAEAAKVIENTQRDLNIALMNELAIIFNELGIDTSEVLAAARTKWNFLPFRPGLVGGHCIGVDPYYLTHKAESIGYHPQVILAGRRINDGMGKFIAEQTVKAMLNNGQVVKGAKVLIMGLTFKENCPDIRNTRVVDVKNELEAYGLTPVIWDPVADAAEVEEEYQLKAYGFSDLPKVDAIIAAVAHKQIIETPMSNLVEQCGTNVPFIDVKSMYDKEKLKNLGYKVWRL